MDHLLSCQQRAEYRNFRNFVSTNIEPFAEAWDREQKIPEHVISMISKCGYLGPCLPKKYGGQEWDIVTFGLLSEAIGRGSSSLTDVLTVQAMVSMALLKWGTEEQKARWLPSLARGEIIGAFALTESHAGSATQSLTTEYTQSSENDCFILNGEKQWITYGQHAGLFLIFGNLRQRPVVGLVPAGTPGLNIEPINGLMGFRAAGLAKLVLRNVQIPSANMVGRVGFALSHVALFGLQYGRLSTACSALGLLRGCFEESISYASTRKIADKTVGDFGMIRTLIAKMGAELEAAAFLCHNACRSEDDHLPEAFEKALTAKYFTSRAAVRAAADAVQIRGASGCHESSAVSRFYRDAKIMEIIEGTTQIHEQLLGKIYIDQADRLGK